MVYDECVCVMLQPQQQQVMKLLGRVEDWADPNKPIFGPFVNLADSEAKKLVQTLTGVADLAGAFAEVKGRIKKLFDLWDSLPHAATRLIWSKLPEAAEVAKIAGVARQVAGFTEQELVKHLQKSLVDLPLLNTPEGKALESLAATGLFAAINGNQELKDIQKAAGLVSRILDGSTLQSLLTKLQGAIDTKLDLKKLEAIVLVNIL